MSVIDGHTYLLVSETRYICTQHSLLSYAASIAPSKWPCWRNHTPHTEEYQYWPRQVHFYCLYISLFTTINNLSFRSQPLIICHSLLISLYLTSKGNSSIFRECRDKFSCTLWSRKHKQCFTRVHLLQNITYLLLVLPNSVSQKITVRASKPRYRHVDIK
jgi:hypothetical protein